MTLVTLVEWLRAEALTWLGRRELRVLARDRGDANLIDQTVKEIGWRRAFDAEFREEYAYEALVFDV